MSNAIVLSNHKLLVNLGYDLALNDFYFPYVGQDNHLTKYRNPVLIAIDGVLQNLADPLNKITIDYDGHLCISNSAIEFEEYGVRIEFEDFITIGHDILVRRFRIVNSAQVTHEVRVYFQNNFALNESLYADTVVWYQPAGALLHYKKHTYLAMGSKLPFYQFSCAAKSDNSGLGAYPDNRGELYFNPVATGNVNSCISFRFLLTPGMDASGDYFIAASDNLPNIDGLVKYYKETPYAILRREVTNYWTDLVARAMEPCSGKDFPCDGEFVRRSIMIMMTQISANGAIIAANDGQFLKAQGTDSYSYYWPRDAALVIMTLIELGLNDWAEKCLEFALSLSGHNGYFLHKYFPGSEPDRISLGSSWHPWINYTGNEQLPIQEDATALMLLAVEAYYKKFQNRTFLIKNWNHIEAIIKFLKSYTFIKFNKDNSIFKFVTGFKFDYRNSLCPNCVLPYPSYDIWEQYWGVFSYTTIMVYQAVKAGVDLAELINAKYLKEDLIIFSEQLKNEILTKMINTETKLLIKGVKYEENARRVEVDYKADASLLLARYFVNDQEVLDLVDRTIVDMIPRLNIASEIGGLARKEDDHYLRVNTEFTGNPWILTKIWYASFVHDKEGRENAISHLKWVKERADHTGLLPEQVNPHTGYSIGVKPLTWSHADFIRTVLLILNK